MTHGRGEIVGAHGEAVDPGHPADRLHLADAGHVLEEGQDHRLLVGAADVLRGREAEELRAAPRREAPPSLRRVLHRAHGPLGVGAGRDVGDHDRRRPDVEIAEDDLGGVDGDADGHRQVVEVGGTDHLLALAFGEGSVLGVEKDLVHPAPAEHLDEPRGVELERRGEHGPTRTELLLEPLASHRGLPLADSSGPILDAFATAP